MPRPARPWFRFYVEAIRDPKMDRLTPSERWLWVVILAAARQSPEPGYLMIAEGVAMGWTDLVRASGMKLKEVEHGTDLMTDMKMLAFEDGRWFVPAFQHRQFESDDVTARTAKHRSKEHDGNVPANENGTDNSDSVSVSVSSIKNSDEIFDRFWAVFPRRTSKGTARAAFAKALKRASFDVILAGAERYRDDPNRDEVMPHPATWLNQDRWEDDPLPPKPATRGRDPNHNQRTIERVSSNFEEILSRNRMEEIT